MENLSQKHRLVSRTYYQKSLTMASTFGSKSNFFMTMSIPSQDEPLTNRPVAIALPQDVPSTSDSRLIELENQVQRLMEAHLALTQPTQVNKITTSCEICSGPHDTQYCMEDPEQAFVEYASSRTDEAGVLKAITDRIKGALPSDTIKNLKLSTSPVLLACSYPTLDPQCSTHVHGSMNVIMIHPKQQSDTHDDKIRENEEEEKVSPENINVDPSKQPDQSVSFISEKVLKLNSFFKSLGLVSQSSSIELVFTKGDDNDVMFIEIVKKYDDSHEEEPEAREHKVEYFDIFPTKSELAYHKYLMCDPIPLIFLRNPISSRYHATLGMCMWKKLTLTLTPL
ncbi:hypothetical protein Tco_0791197 [Tanacetum coccineum]